MRSRRSLVLGVPVVLATIAGAGAGPGCYGATEISVAVTTTVACSPSFMMTTQIFTGPIDTTDFGTAPSAETAQCGSVEPRVGTLAIVPSGSRDERFELEVVGAAGVASADCRDAALGRNAVAPGVLVAAKTTGCIVAKRRVSFRPHRSLTIPVLLSARCIGVPCGADQTCDLGVCTPTVDCTDDGCPRERAEVAPPVDDAATGADAGADVSVDAPADVDASKPRCTATPEVVIGGESILGPLVQQGPDFVYLNGSSATTDHEIHRVPRAGAAMPTVIMPMVPNTSFLASLAATSTDLAWFEQGNDATAVLSRDGGAPRLATHPVSPHDHTSLAFSTTTPDLMVGFWRASGTPFAFTLKWEPASGTFFDPPDVPTVPGEVSKVLVDSIGDFYGIAGDTLLHYQVAATFAPSEKGRMSQSLGHLMPDFALVGRTLYVAAGPLADPPKMAGIYQIPADSIADIFAADAWIPSSPPQSMTTDGTRLYYLVGTTLWRVNLAASPAMTPVPEHFGDTIPNMAATRLEVDDQCVYWVQGDTTIMKRAK